MKLIFYIKSTLTFVLILLSGLVFGQTSPHLITTTGAGSFTVPCGVTSLTVECWGGGGAGGGTTSNPGAGGGGGGGAYVINTITVTPGQVINYTVGAGGATGTGNGGNGGNTTFSTLTANGGSGGLSFANGGTGGTGGTGSGGTVTNGGNGTNSTATPLSGTGGTGGTGGAGGAGFTGNANGNAGAAPGGGGGGACKNASSGGNRDGGAGARGQIRLTWTASLTCLSPTTNQSYTNCAANWTDGGGVSGNYANSQNYTVTFCPTNPGDAVRVDFLSFATQGSGGTCNDFLDVWMANSNAGPNADRFCGTLSPFTIISTSPDGCLTFQFTSDGSTVAAGWNAIVSCVTGCTNPTASVAGSPIVSICPATAENPGSLTVNFDGSGSTAGSGWSLAGYDWDFGDGATATTGGATTSHTYPGPGVYIATLIVRDNNTGIFPTGCPSTNSASRVIQVIPEPSFSGTTTSPVATTCGNCATLTARATSQNYVQPLPEVVTGAVALPDGTGVSYTSGADYSGYFQPGATVTPGCYPTVCFNLEHSWAGDLNIELISPNGTIVRLFQGGGAFNSRKFGDCVNGSDANPVVPGCGRNYCVVNSGGVAWTSATSTATSPCAGYAGPCEAGNYYISQTYNSFAAFSAFDGNDLNGVWTLRITDNIGADNGVLFGWSMTFPPGCYRDLAFITPDISSVTWQTHTGGGPAVPAQSPSSIGVSDPGPDPCPGGQSCLGTQVTNTINLCTFNSIGAFTYDFIAQDEFGCQFERSITVNVDCPLPIELLEFGGVIEGANNRLYWTTASEVNNDYFTLERSRDGMNFEVLATIQAAGNSSQVLNYHNYDYHPHPTVSYYRLKQTDFDGEYSYSQTIALSRTSTVATVSDLFPNPAHTGVNFDLNTPKAGVVQVLMYDNSGRLISSNSFEAHVGSNSYHMDIQNLATGVYNVVVEFDQLEKREVKQLIKQ